MSQQCFKEVFGWTFETAMNFYWKLGNVVDFCEEWGTHCSECLGLWGKKVLSKYFASSLFLSLVPCHVCFASIRGIYCRKFSQLFCAWCMLLKSSKCVDWEVYSEQALYKLYSRFPCEGATLGNCKRNLWILGIWFLCWSMVTFGDNTCLPSFFFFSTNEKASFEIIISIKQMTMKLNCRKWSISELNMLFVQSLSWQIWEE